jgi:hypothetical protein
VEAREALKLREEIREVLARVRPTDYVGVEARCVDGIMEVLHRDWASTTLNTSTSPESTRSQPGEDAVEKVWSFDDEHIGRTVTNNSLQDHVIRRPYGLARSHWYALASKVCAALNAAAMTQGEEKGR